jgi:hypothetical protein
MVSTRIEAALARFATTAGLLEFNSSSYIRSQHPCHNSRFCLPKTDFACFFMNWTRPFRTLPKFLPPPATNIASADDRRACTATSALLMSLPAMASFND